MFTDEFYLIKFKYMNQIAINTSQNVNINFTVASIGERMLAFAIDMFIKCMYLLFLYFIFFKIFSFNQIINKWDNLSIYAFVLLITLPFYVYTLVLESLMEGQTFGKKIVKIKVVKVDGYQATFSDFLIRWFFRLVDVFFSSGVVAIVSIVISKHNKRLGDLLSGTAVITLKNKVNINHTIFTEIGKEYQPTFTQVIALSDNDMHIIKTHFKQANAKGNYQLIQKLAFKIRETLGISKNSTNLHDKQFIETVIKDFNFYTGKETR